MGSEIETKAGRAAALSAVAGHLTHELHHLRSNWWWLMLLGVLLTVSGTAAIVFPQLTVITSFTVTTLLGVLLMVSGVAIIVGAFWAGKWSGLLLQLLVGILYLAAGFVMTENTVITALIITVFIAMSFIVLGAFRIVGALLLHFPQWGWVLLNGVITMLAGIVIYRQLPGDALWVIGLLVGLEMLFNGWTWIMLSLAIRNLPAEPS
ncbi:MAG: HdeD family acid-resistance protein [Planctomycetia bacterium]|nr:HdeD family acid-resistance protein [Planctomycetia bacterium]